MLRNHDKVVTLLPLPVVVSVEVPLVPPALEEMLEKQKLLGMDGSQMILVHHQAVFPPGVS